MEILFNFVCVCMCACIKLTCIFLVCDHTLTSQTMGPFVALLVLSKSPQCDNVHGVCFTIFGPTKKKVIEFIMIFEIN